LPWKLGAAHLGRPIDIGMVERRPRRANIRLRVVYNTRYLSFARGPACRNSRLTSVWAAARTKAALAGVWERVLRACGVIFPPRPFVEVRTLPSRDAPAIAGKLVVDGRANGRDGQADMGARPNRNSKRMCWGWP